MMQNSCPKAAATVGKVWLVGAGPGDPELLTLKALKVLKRCNVWLVDDLAGAGVLALAPEGTRVLNVGKRGGCRSLSTTRVVYVRANDSRAGVPAAGNPSTPRASTAQTTASAIAPITSAGRSVSLRTSSNLRASSSNASPYVGSVGGGEAEVVDC